LILAGYFTGGRLSDLARLKWSNVDLTEKSITFIQRKVEGKTSKARVKIPIHPVLEEYLLSGPISAAPGAPVFPELHDKPGAGKSGLSMAFKRIMDKAGIAAGLIRERGRDRWPKCICAQLSQFAAQRAADPRIRHCGQCKTTSYCSVQSQKA
jgi:integrase